jgi:SWIM/SEC-C metal-binding protein
MSNRINDIGTLRSSVGTDRRNSSFGPKRNAKLGSEKNPAVVRVQTNARFKEVSAAFAAHGWRCRIGIEPDQVEDIGDLERLLNPAKPVAVAKKLGRNEPCSCGSGKKFKNCCGK